MKSLVSECLQEVLETYKLARANGDLRLGHQQYYILIKRMLDDIATREEHERVEIRQGLNDEEWGLVFGIASSMAELSVQDKDPQKLKYGILALLVEDMKEDYRESLIRLTLLNCSAEILGVDLREIFDQVKHIGTSRTRDLFEQYFAEGGKTGDFTYKRAW
jgi:hypothetical protein